MRLVNGKINIYLNSIQHKKKEIYFRGKRIPLSINKTLFQRFTFGSL